ncbi:inositol monophosphatase [Pseudomonas taiwanensis]|uniref:inositol monophosphatase family protein n=1 Tax=Pseudomonas taiwanensis TaxID=470150 RepID=UPI0015C078AC|nr:inositol monophosphatase family protein [Pseudomonas taiwanensis]NWL76142.1 inositol monophosphatase [Pseudomonas taiwanensis]
MHDVDLPNLLGYVISEVLDAGNLMLAEWARPKGPRRRKGKSVVDTEIEWQLRDALKEALECNFWGRATGYVLTGDPWCWVVNPNDGSNDFLKGRMVSTISVGLLYEGVPVLGVVYAPITDEFGPDCIAWAEGLPHLLRNGHEVRNDLSEQNLSAGSAVLVGTTVLQPYLKTELCAPGQCMAMTSIAYRLALTAAGDAVCAISLDALSAHDVVAGHALLRACGGVLLNQDGQAITYGTEATMITASQHCLGGAPQACAVLLHREWIT